MPQESLSGLYAYADTSSDFLPGRAKTHLPLKGKAFPTSGRGTPGSLFPTYLFYIISAFAGTSERFSIAISA